ncbi:prefoldin subunit 3-like [Tubulanus polymorphus]|uniref:prefoldin subunit 3-like n=1 Tax=Tubulanus polymorphus TaxID=672921 RepID=UPI003DA3A681
MASSVVADASDKNENSSNIPKASFVEDVDEFMKAEGNENPEATLRRFDEQHQKYKFMEYNLTTKKARLKSQIPDIKQSLDIVKYLKSKKDSTDVIQTNFLLSDQLYAKATIPPTEKVCLWLGANVMLEYNLDDADALLTKNLDAATSSLELVDNDLGFIRDQTTTLEVNMARVYNWDVKKRQTSKKS